MPISITEAASRLPDPNDLTSNDPVKQAVGQMLAQEQLTIKGVQAQTPQQHAQTIDLANKTGLPRPVVERNAPSLQEMLEQRDKFDVAKNFPALQSVMVNDRNLGGILQNDIRNLFDVSKNPILDIGVGMDMEDGSRRYFTRRPIAEDFPVGELGFAAASQQLRRAQDLWDNSGSNGVAAPLYSSVNNPRVRSYLEANDLISNALSSGWERGKRAFSTVLDEIGVTSGLYEQQRAAGFDPLMSKSVYEANRQREIEALAPPLEIQDQLQEIQATTTLGDAFMAMLRNPKAAEVMFFESLGMTAPGMASSTAGGAVGGPIGTMTATGLSSFAIEYGATIEQTLNEYGLDPSDARSWYDMLQREDLMEHAREKAIQRGTPIALFDAMTGLLAGRFIRNATPDVGSVAPRAGAEVALQAGGGAGGEAVAQVNAGEEYKPADIVMEAVAELPTAVPEAVGNYIGTKNRAKTEKEARDRKALAANEQAERVRQAVAALSGTEALTTGDTGRQALTEVLNQSAPDATLTIGARQAQQVLQQQGMTLQDIQATAPNLARQLPEALGIGGDVVIPTGEFLGAFAQTELMEPLLQHVRTSPDAMTLAEAQEYAQSGDATLQADMQKTLDQMRGDEAFQTSRENVRQIVLGELNKANRFTTAKNEIDAILIASRYSARASRLGITPEELFQKQPLTVRAEGIEGQAVLDQDFIGTPDGTVKFSRNRFAQLFSEHMYPDGQVHAAVAFINPQDFVNATTVGEREAQVIADDVAGEPIDMAKIQQDILPYLDVEVGENGAVRLRNHEGRHRMQRLADAGYTRVPVRFVNRDAEYGDRSLLGLPQNGEIGGQRFYDGETSESALPYENLIEITPDNRQLLLDTFEASESDAFMQSAYHGSPHEFSRFSLEAIGTGEGAQAFGWGLYFADRREIAEWYRDTLSEPELQLMGERIKSVYTGDIREQYRSLYEEVLAGRYDSLREFVLAEIEDAGGDVRSAEVAFDEFVEATIYLNTTAYDQDANRDQRKLMEDQSYRAALILNEVNTENRFELNEILDDVENIFSDLDIVIANVSQASTKADLKYVVRDFIVGEQLDIYREYVEPRLTMTEPKGMLYQVDIPEDEELLQYDKPLSQQSEFVQKALESAGFTVEDMAEYDRQLLAALEFDAPVPAEMKDYTGEQIYNIISKAVGRATPFGREIVNAVGLDIYGDIAGYSNDHVASLYLNSLGIPGLRYLDRGSRRKGEGDHNYVIWDEQRVTMEAVNDELVQAQVYEQNKSGRRGSYNPTTNTITLLESADLSTFLHESGHFFFENDIALASELVGKDVLSDGEQQIVNDVHTLFNWHGFQGPISEQINTWYSMTLDEKRAFHEKTAESFEAYLFSGKAPSIELQGVFQTFRTWLISVYRSIKDFLTRYPSAGALNPEVREVFDRMLATDTEIAAAQQARSMFPMFESAEQAGMTPDEFRAYQKEHADATADAQEELQSKGLRDMQWAASRKSREIKRLQKLSKETRARVRMDVRREVMSQPIYQAWTFLTGRMTEDDKLPEQPAARKSVAGDVDPSIDTLLTAIAKLGGLDRQELTSQWGVDPKERSPMPLFGQYVIRREGGLSIDKMAEALSQYGYLTIDENGKWDLADFEAKFDDALRGDDIYSSGADYDVILGSSEEVRAGEQVANPRGLGAGRFDLSELELMDLPAEVIQRLRDFKMTAKMGLHPDIVAELFGFTSGDELVRALATTESPQQAIDGRLDQIMLERFGELSSIEAIEQAADAAIHNEVRSRMMATELEALGRSTGRDRKERRAIVQAADSYARRIIARTKIRDLRASRYEAAASRAGNSAAQLLGKNRRTEAYAEKRNQILNTRAARVTHEAIEEVRVAINYLKKFSNEGTRKNLDRDYLDQIDTILERFDLSTNLSGRTIDKRKALSAWIESQEEMGIEIDIPEKLRSEAFRQSYKELTVEEMRGLVDTVKQIEHLARLKNRLLTAKDQRDFRSVVVSLVNGIEKNAKNRKKRDNRTRDTAANRAANLFRGFLAEHRKIASLARQMDGFEEAGPVWSYLIRGMNEAGDREATMRADATRALMAILNPVLKGKRLGGKGVYIKSLGESLNRGERIVIALNMGNEGNMQRLLDGKNWTREQVQEILDSLTAEELQAVQGIWDFFESYRPMIAEKELRVTGKEPEWVEPMPLNAKNGSLRGGYFPIVYDPSQSGRAEQFADAEQAKQQMRGAFVASTTRRSFTKSRAAEVTGRPLLLTFDGLFRGANEVIHDLAWHEWVIDANRIIRNGAVDQAIRDNYGAEIVRQFKDAIRDIATGDVLPTDSGERVMRHFRAGAAVAGLGFNLLNSAIQPLGLTQSVVRIGARWVYAGFAEWSKSPIDLVNRIRGMSPFMANRMQTMQRELNEIQSVIQGKSKVRRMTDQVLFLPMQYLQLVADIPTWWGAYQKALTDAPLNLDPEAVESRAIALADQAVIDSQSGGQVKDLAGVQRGSGWKKLFSVFYGYFSATYNLAAERTRATEFKDPKQVSRLAFDYMMLMIVPSVGYTLIKAALQGDAGDDNDDLMEKLIADQISYLMGMFMYVREVTPAVQAAMGLQTYGYQGPGGLRIVGDTLKFAVQVSQGELDDAFRRSFVNVVGTGLKLPSAQINRTLDGLIAIMEGKTSNPLGVVFGVRR